MNANKFTKKVKKADKLAIILIV